MKKWLFVFVVVVFTFGVVFGNQTASSNNYILNDFVVRSLSSTMLFDNSRSFSLGVGYKQFSSENYLLGGLRFTNFYIWNAKLGGYLNVIVPIKYLYDGNFWERWWSKIWLDAWLYLSF